MNEVVFKQIDSLPDPFGNFLLLLSHGRTLATLLAASTATTTTGAHLDFLKKLNIFKTNEERVNFKLTQVSNTRRVPRAPIVGSGV